MLGIIKSFHIFSVGNYIYTLAKSVVKRQIFFLVAISVILINCKKNEDPVNEVDLDIRKFSERDFFLSETCDSLEYVFLETCDSNFIGKISTIKISSNFIILVDGITNKVHAFKRNGKYLFEIARKGKGPGEYLQVDDLVIDEQQQCVYLSAGMKKVLKYSLDNKFLETINLDVGPRFLSIYTEGLVSIVKCPLTLNYNHCTFNFLGVDGKIKAQKIQHEISSFTGNEPLTYSSLYTVNDTLCFWEGYFNEIYGLTKRGEVIHRWTLSYPPDKISQKSMRSLESFSKAVKTGFTIVSFFESSRHFFVGALENGKRVHLVIDKLRKHNIRIQSTTSGNLILNNIDGIANFWPTYFPGSNMSMMVIEPNNFKANFNRARLLPLEAQKLSIYYNKVRDLHEFDNPILCIANYK